MLLCGSGVIVFITDKSCDTISLLLCVVRLLLYLPLTSRARKYLYCCVWFGCYCNYHWQVVGDNIFIAVCGSGVIVFIITDKSCETITLLLCVVRVLLYLSLTSRSRQYLYCCVWFGCYCIYHWQILWNNSSIAVCKSKLLYLSDWKSLMKQQRYFRISRYNVGIGAI